MPVRIYDIAKKLGLENKDILTKAKEMGITAAKVPSSSLDKISAEWLEEEIIKTNPAVAARFAPKPVEAPKPVVEEKIVIIHAPEPLPEPAVEIQPEPEPVIEEKIIAEAAPASAGEISQPAPIAVPPPAPKPIIPVTPPRPQMGEKVGFIQLSPRPGSARPGERGGERGGQPPRPQVVVPANRRNAVTDADNFRSAAAMGVRCQACRRRVRPRRKRQN